MTLRVGAGKHCCQQSSAAYGPRWCALLPAALTPALAALLQIKRDTARTRNDIESYIISMRDKMESDELLANVGRLLV